MNPCAGEAEVVAVDAGRTAASKPGLFPAGGVGHTLDCPHSMLLPTNVLQRKTNNGQLWGEKTINFNNQ